MKANRSSTNVLKGSVQILATKVLETGGNWKQWNFVRLVWPFWWLYN